MTWRDRLNQNSTVVTIIAVVVLALALWFLYYQRSPAPAGTPTVYFYDLKSTAGNPIDRLFPVKDPDLPPIPSPSDAAGDEPSGVRAYVFTCGSCADPSEMFIGFLERYTPEYKESMRKMATPGEQAGPPGIRPGFMDGRGRQISAPDNIAWIEFMSPQGTKLQTDLVKRCGEQPPTGCLPTGTK